nr:SH3 domain-containing protein [Roseovarius albus]
MVVAIALFFSTWAAAQERGPVTNLPLPRFVSMKATEANIRRGPSLTHKIDWVYKQKDIPLQIIAEHGHWRQVRDRDGAGGWIHYSLLSGARTVLVERDMLALRKTPTPDGVPQAHLELGVVARIEKCELGWCRLSAGGYKGWAEKVFVWGVGTNEILE